MSEINKKTDEEILFPEITIEGEVLKPWSFGKLFDLSPMLESVIDKMEAKGIDLDFNKEFIPYLTLAKLFTIATSEVLKIISITLDKPEEEIKKFDMQKGVKIAMGVYEQNKEVIKNALSPLLIPVGGKKTGKNKKS